MRARHRAGSARCHGDAPPWARCCRGYPVQPVETLARHPSKSADARPAPSLRLPPLRSLLSDIREESEEEQNQATIRSPQHGAGRTHTFKAPQIDDPCIGTRRRLRQARPATDTITGSQAGRARAGRIDKVLRIHELNTTGEIHQANLTFPMRFHYSGDPLALYAPSGRVSPWRTVARQA